MTGLSVEKRRRMQNKQIEWADDIPYTYFRFQFLHRQALKNTYVCRALTHTHKQIHMHASYDCSLTVLRWILIKYE